MSKVPQELMNEQILKGIDAGDSPEEACKNGYKAILNQLEAAVYELYIAAHWSPDRDCDAEELWEAVRVSACIKPGNSPTPVLTDEEPYV